MPPDGAGAGADATPGDGRTGADIGDSTSAESRDRADEQAAAAPPGTVVVNAVPLLVETNLVHLFDLVVVVDVPVVVQLVQVVIDVR